MHNRTMLTVHDRPKRTRVRCGLTAMVSLVVVHTVATLSHPQEPAAPPQDRQSQVDTLAQKSDPTADDWETEALHVHAKHQLKRLADGLVGLSADGGDLELGSVFSPDARVTALSPPTVDVLTRSDVRVRRATRDSLESAAMLRPSRALFALMRPYAGASDPRIAFKITAVGILDDKTFTTTTLFQSSGRSTSGPVQANAEWTITWKDGPDSDHPLIHRIRLVAFHETVATLPRFTECTRSVLTEDVVWTQQLLRGGEHWYGKIDAVGEINYLGHQGIAVGDVNGDGLDDLYVAMGTGLPNKLFVQNPDGSARDVALESGVAWLDDTKGVLLVDIDNDGDQDLLCAMGPSIVLCQNDGSGLFTPVNKLRAATDASFYSLAAADYDLDGDLDIFATRYVKIRYGQSVPMPFHDANNGPPNHLLRNDREKGFTDVTHTVGITNNSRFSLAAGWGDYDNDGDSDLYVANDFGRNNLYRNDAGTFSDVAAAAGVEDQAAGMGVSWADFDLDGDIDLCVSNMFSSAGQRIAYQSRFQQGQSPIVRAQIQHHSLGNSLFANAGDGTFRDVSRAAGVRMGRWSWGAKFVDMDNDGYDDLMVPNGFLTNDRADDL